jgi:AAA15 family ATPase/GTPase
MQKLKIKNFGPITNCQLDITDYLIFIGPQASGKSTISKGIYFFKSLREDLINYIYESVENGKIDKPLGTYAKRIRSKFLKFWGSTFHLNDIYLEYCFSDDISIKITLEPNSRYVTPDFSENFKTTFLRIINETKSFIRERDKKNPMFLSSNELLEIDHEKRTFFTKIRNMSNELFGETKDLLFIPAGRSLLATLSEQLQLINPEKLDFLMMAFVNRINNYKTVFNKSLSDIVTEKKKLTQDIIDFESISIAQGIIRKILKGEYRYDKDGEKIFVSKDKYTKLNYSSSGQQEVIWILHLIFLLILEKKSVFIVIEEPEAHLFPEAQKELVELISLMANQNSNQIIITTHSPYILSSINNLIYAGKIGKYKKEIVSKQIDSKLWIDINKIGAFYIHKGCYENIIDDELDLIKAETIDSASRIINDEYNFLFDLED